MSRVLVLARYHCSHPLSIIIIMTWSVEWRAVCVCTHAMSTDVDDGQLHPEPVCCAWSACSLGSCCPVHMLHVFHTSCPHLGTCLPSSPGHESVWPLDASKVCQGMNTCWWVPLDPTRAPFVLHQEHKQLWSGSLHNRRCCLAYIRASHAWPMRALFKPALVGPQPCLPRYILSRLLDAVVCVSFWVFLLGAVMFFMQAPSWAPDGAV